MSIERDTKLNLLRQTDLVRPEIGDIEVTLVGAGAIGSLTAIVLTKMGVSKLTVYDEDGIASHNVANQFYGLSDIGQYKVDALKEIIHDFSGVEIETFKRMYNKQQLGDLVIAATDSMASRRMVWEQFKKQDHCRWYIEARMGALLGRVYTLRDRALSTITKYEDTLYKDSEVKPLPCTAQAIMFNVFMIASLIGRSVVSLVNSELIPWEMIFNMQDINRVSFMVRED